MSGLNNLDKKPLTARERRFLAYIIEGKSKTDAYLSISDPDKMPTKHSAAELGSKMYQRIKKKRNFRRYSVPAGLILPGSPANSISSWMRKKLFTTRAKNVGRMKTGSFKGVLQSCLRSFFRFGKVSLISMFLLLMIPASPLFSTGQNLKTMTIELHEKQTEVFDSTATEILFGGAAGPGKSYFLRVSPILWGYDIPGLQTYLFRRTFDDLEKNHMEGPSGYRSLFADWVAQRRANINDTKHTISLANGSKIFLCHAQHEKDVYKYQGAEIHLLLIDELTHFTAKMYRYLRGRVRLGSFVLPEKYRNVFPRIISATNPGGVGHNWVKATFVDYAPPMEIVRTPKTEGGMLRQFIPALLSDNPTMQENDPDYADRLHGLGSEALVRAMLKGDWDIVAGGGIDDVWRRIVHVIKPFKIPSSWYVDRTFDWGSAKPFSVGFWAESDGTPAILADGTRKTFPRGTVIRIGEWYGWNGQPNEGCRATDDEIGKGIRKHENALIEYHNGLRFHLGPADSSIFEADPGKDSIAQGVNAGYWGKQVSKNKHIFTEADKSPGSRVRGLQALRRRLKAALAERPEEPGFYVFDTCTHWIRTCPVLPRDERKPEDIDTAAEDHAYDETRYRLLAARRVAKRVRISGV